MEQEKDSTPSVSPPILGENRKADALVYRRIYGLIRTRAGCEDARSGRASLPKTGRVGVGLTLKNHFSPDGQLESLLLLAVDYKAVSLYAEMEC